MERTPDGTPVGVDDPYDVAGICDHLTDDGRCRYALEHAGEDPAFAAERRRDGYACHVGAEGNWSACPRYRSTTDGRACRRCGLESLRLAHESTRPLIEEHHLQYATRGTERGSAGEPDTDGAASGPHEITVALCRWCHAKVHRSIARIDDDASHDPDAIAERERRRSAEQAELSFTSARDRYADGDDDEDSGRG
ncbi:DUF7097 family protein [Halopenitus persicus]|uniref:Uncharacterized protein n=1 Tax=Halopenitus persicus TaxID=1048396 RepID=A0A1H3IMB2_9EURY|nr:hypothetical protein [Halopenitus persicus]SDY28495.1 hypothetical protein SAMN05216564_104172 [Halopenitus persicus]